MKILKEETLTMTLNLNLFNKENAFCSFNLNLISLFLKVGKTCALWIQAFDPFRYTAFSQARTRAPGAARLHGLDCSSCVASGKYI